MISAAGKLSAGCISNIIISSARIRTLHKIHPVITIMLIFLVVAGILYLIVEPEKLKTMAYLSTFTVLMMAYCCFGDNLKLIWNNPNRFHNMDFVNF
jgi:uncharacterized membrane protein